MVSFLLDLGFSMFANGLNPFHGGGSLEYSPQPKGHGIALIQSPTSSILLMLFIVLNKNQLM